eukprot:188870_1
MFISQCMAFLVVLLFAVNTAQTIINTKSNWPVFGGDSAHTGYKNIDLLTNGNATLLWSKTILPSLTYATISNNKYYTISGKRFNSLGYNLYILNALTGDQIESINIGEGDSIGPPIEANGQIIINMVGSNEGLYIKSYVNNNYNMKWQATGGAQWPNYPYGVTPSDIDTTIYFAGGTYNGEMYAVNGLNGISEFTAHIPTGFGCDYWAPTVYKGRVFMNAQPGEGNGYLAEIDTINGNVLKEIDLPSEWDGYTTGWVTSIANNIAIASNRSNSRLGYNGIDLSTYKIIWNHQCAKPSTFTGSFLDYTAATDGIYVFIVCKDEILSLSLINGVLIKNYYCSNCGGQPIVTNDVLIVNSEEGVKIFNKISTQLIQILNNSGMIALYQNKLYVTNQQDGSISAYIFDKDLQFTTTTTTLMPTPQPIESVDTTAWLTTPYPTWTQYPTWTPYPTSESGNSVPDNINNSLVIVLVIVVGIVIFIAGILIGCGYIKYKMNKQMAEGETEGAGEEVMNANINIIAIEKESVSSNMNIVSVGEGMKNALLNQQSHFEKIQC